MSSPLDDPRPYALERLLFDVVVSTASVVGDEYFGILPRVLANAMDVTAAFVAEVRPGEPSAPWRLLGIEPAVDDTNVAIECLAAEPARRGKVAFVPRGAQSKFPEDVLLRQTGSDSCLAVPVHGSAGSVVGIVAVMKARDMTGATQFESILRLISARVGAEIERQRAVDELSDKGELLRSIVERSQDMIFRYTVKPALKFEYVSPSTKDVLGYSPEEFYNDPALAMRIVHPDFHTSLMSLYAGDDTVTRKSGWIRRDGATVWTEGRRRMIRDEAGDVVAIETFMRDITAQHVAEEGLERARAREQLLFDALPDTVLRVSLDGVILDYRPPNRGDPVFHAPRIGAAIETFLPGYACASLRQALSSLQANGSQSLHFKVDAIALSRSIDARVVSDGDEGAIVFLRDVTGSEWLAKEDRRHQTRDQIDEAAERRAARGNAYALTFREFAVLDLVRGGASDKELAAILGISTSTASKHVSNVLSKMGVGSRTEAVARAMSEGLLD